MKANPIFVLCAGALLLGGAVLWSDSAEGAASCPLATGSFDQEAAASNQITTCKVLEAIGLVRDGRVARLGRDYENGMPLFGARVFEFSQVVPQVPPGDENTPTPSGGPFGDNLFIFNEGLLTSEIDQVGTQFDGIGHAGRARKEGDPTKGYYYLNKPVQQVNATPAEPEGGGFAHLASNM